jgi:O-antigen ligase
VTAARATAIALAALPALFTLTIGARPRWPQAAVQCATYLLGIAWAAGFALGRRSFRFSPLLAPLAAIPLWGLAQLALGFTVYTHDTVVAVLHWTALLCLFAVAAQALGNHDRQLFLNLFLAFAAAMALAALIAPGAPRWLAAMAYPVGPDFLGPFQNRNNYAAFVLLALPVAVWRGLTGGGDAWAGWAAAALLYATVIGSGSRAGSALATLEIPALLAVAAARGLVSVRRTLQGAGAFAAMAAAFTAAAGWDLLWRRIALDDPLEYRREIYRSALAMIAERPWTGFGLGTFETAYPRFALFDAGVIVNYAHNDWLEWAATGGLPMLALAAAVVLGGAWIARRELWALGIVFVALHALVDFPMQRMGVAAWLFALLGVAAAGSRTVRPLALRRFRSRPACSGR